MKHVNSGLNIAKPLPVLGAGRISEASNSCFSKGPKDITMNFGKHSKSLPCTYNSVWQLKILCCTFTPTNLLWMMKSPGQISAPKDPIHLISIFGPWEINNFCPSPSARDWMIRDQFCHPKRLVASSGVTTSLQVTLAKALGAFSPRRVVIWWIVF